MKYTAVVKKEEDMYIAKCKELGTVSQGETVEKALYNLSEATKLFLRERDESYGSPKFRIENAKTAKSFRVESN